FGTPPFLLLQQGAPLRRLEPSFRGYQEIMLDQLLRAAAGYTMQLRCEPMAAGDTHHLCLQCDAELVQQNDFAAVPVARLPGALRSHTQACRAPSLPVGPHRGRSGAVAWGGPTAAKGEAPGTSLEARELHY